jgi:hypothetical protein
VKPTLCFLICVLLASVAGACGSERERAGAASSPVPAALPRIQLGSDVDEDSDSYPHEPPDNEHALPGHPAAAADVRSLAALVRRYYAYAARDDGAAACRLLYLTRAESVAAEGYGGTAARLSGTCAAGLSSLFRRMHRQLSADSSTLRVGTVRDELNTASVQLFFGRGRPPRYIEGHRERGTWKVGMLLDGERSVGAE